MFKDVDIYESEKIHQYCRCCHNIYMELKKFTTTTYQRCIYSSFSLLFRLPLVEWYL